ncbi:MAG TPA: hypothetical protein VG246_07255 [Acidimicrobiales bacterium]|nr:hypothetical protein [Acidimicrobiales bacterium]
MKQLVARGMVTLGLVASLGFGVSAVASAGGLPPLGGTTTTTGATSTALKIYHQELTAYRASRTAIEATFRASINLARSNYQKALLSATTSAQRSAAEQNKVTAIINAASTRSSELIALGNAPTPPAS